MSWKKGGERHYIMHFYTPSNTCGNKSFSPVLIFNLSVIIPNCELTENGFFILKNANANAITGNVYNEYGCTDQ